MSDTECRHTQKTGCTSESPTLGSFYAFRPVMLGSHKTLHLATFSSPPCTPVPSGNYSMVLGTSRFQSLFRIATYVDSLLGIGLKLLCRNAFTLRYRIALIPASHTSC